MKLKYIVGFIGLIVAIIGWLLDHHKDYPFIYHLVTPEYVSAMAAYDKMYEKDFTLQQDDIGFSEISRILKNIFLEYL